MLQNYAIISNYSSVLLHLNNLILGMWNVYYADRVETWPLPLLILSLLLQTYSNLTFYILIMSTFFLHYHSAFFPFLLIRWIGQIIFHLRFVFSHSSVNVCPVFYLKAYLWCTEPFIKMSDESYVSCVVTSNNRQHMVLCAKSVPSWVRESPSVTKTHMLLGTPQGAVVSVALAAGVSLVCILQAGDWAKVCTTARHYFSTYITTTDKSACW